MSDTEPLDLDAIAERAGRAGEELDRLGESRTNWRWSIPADPERDSDLILGASVEDVSALIAEVRRLRAQVSQRRQETEQDIHDWFTSHSSAAVARVVADGQSVIDERMADGVFD